MPNKRRIHSPYYYREEVICNGCGKKFSKYPYLVRPTNYCSLDCYHRSTNLKQERMCLYCKKKFLAARHMFVRGFGKYCSGACQLADAKKTRISTKCLNCGYVKLVSPAVAKHTKYCSKKCHDRAMADLETHRCPACNTLFEIAKSKMREGRGKFCSRECFIKFNGESSLEEKVRHYLEDHKITFTQEKKFGRFRADFTLEDRHLIIECDGEFWHLREYSKLRDLRKTKYLESLGYHVARLTGRQINEQWPRCIEGVLS